MCNCNQQSENQTKPKKICARLTDILFCERKTLSSRETQQAKKEKTAFLFSSTQTLSTLRFCEKKKQGLKIEYLLYCTLTQLYKKMSWAETTLYSINKPKKKKQQPSNLKHKIKIQNRK